VHAHHGLRTRLWAATAATLILGLTAAVVGPATQAVAAVPVDNPASPTVTVDDNKKNTPDVGPGGVLPTMFYKVGQVYDSTAWTHQTGTVTDYDGTESWSNTPQAEITFFFYGTSVSWYGRKQNNLGVAQVTVDNGTPTTVDQFSPTPVGQYTQQLSWSASGLSYGWHSLKIVNVDTTGKYLLLDALTYTAMATSIGISGSAVADDSIWFFQHTTPAKSWFHHTGVSGAYLGTTTSSDPTQPVVAAWLPFIGRANGLVIYGPVGPGGGTAQVYLDGQLVGTMTNQASSSAPAQQVWRGGVPNPNTTIARHWLEILTTGDLLVTVDYALLD
jgi:hypothetical protein